jgi:quinol monooxygenase YgiN
MTKLQHVVPLLALLFAFSAAAPAQQKAGKESQRLYVVTYIDVYPNFADDTKKLLTQFATDSRKDEGFVRMEVLVDLVRSNHFTLTEVWQSKQAFDAHSASAHTKAMRDKIGPMIGAPFDERLYNLVP